MKLIVLTLSMICMSTPAMNVTTLRNYDEDQEKADLLNRLASCSLLEHSHCQHIKANLPLAYNIMCQRPQDSYANFLCDVVKEIYGSRFENITVELLECQGGKSVASEFTFFEPRRK